MKVSGRWDKVAAIFRDPPPELAFEICEAGVSMARTKDPSSIKFQELRPGVLSVSPVHDNVVMADELVGGDQRIGSAGNSRKKYQAALILPDYSARLSVLEFDSFPEKEEDQRALVRFRLKKSVPFDIESAALSYWRQVDTEKKKQEVVVAVTPLEILARYEAPFRARGIQPGFITDISPLAALELVSSDGISAVAKAQRANADDPGDAEKSSEASANVGVNRIDAGRNRGRFVSDVCVYRGPVRGEGIAADVVRIWRVGRCGGQAVSGGA